MDFYILWKNLLMKMQRIKKNMSEKFVEALNKRERTMLILNAPPTLACVFLHYKYGVILSESEKSIAVQHIITVWKSIRKLSDNNAVAASTSSTEEHSAYTEDECVDIDDLLTYRRSLRTIVDAETVLNDSTSAATHAIRRFELFLRSTEPSDSNKTSVEFWCKYKLTEPDLFQVACVINAAAPTQVSVERLFSALSFVLSPQRTRLKDENIDNILVVGQNKELYHLINLEAEFPLPL